MTPQAPSVAIIIPCYNHGRYLGECLQSIKTQTVCPSETVVVDDGSTDDTREVCENFPQVRYVWKENGGVSSARNVGLRETTADLVMFLDADDSLLPNGIEKLQNCISEAGTACGAAFAWARRFRVTEDEDIEVIDEIPCLEDLLPFFAAQIGPDSFILSRSVSHRLLKSSLVPQCAAVIRRWVYDKVGGWNEQLSSVEDRDMWVRIAANVDLAFCKSSVAMVRRHERNRSQSKYWAENHQNIVRLLTDISRSAIIPRRLRRQARSQLATAAYNVSRRLIDGGDYRSARLAMRASLRANPVNPKTLILYAQSLVPWLKKTQLPKKQ